MDWFKAESKRLYADKFFNEAWALDEAIRKFQREQHAREALGE